MKKLILPLLLAAQTSLAADALVRWTPPTERVDGTPLTVSELDKYTIWYGPQGQDLTWIHTEPSGSADQTTVTGIDLSNGRTWCFQADVTDTDGRTSTRSNTSCKTFPSGQPQVIIDLGAF